MRGYEVAAQVEDTAEEGKAEQLDPKGKAPPSGEGLNALGGILVDLHVPALAVFSVGPAVQLGVGAVAGVLVCFVVVVVYVFVVDRLLGNG